MRLGVRRHGLPRRMRFSQSRISWTVSAELPLSVPDHLRSADLHRHQLHGGASSVQVSARLSHNVRLPSYMGKRSYSALVNKFPISNEYPGIYPLGSARKHVLLLFYLILRRANYYVIIHNIKAQCTRDV